MIKSWTPASVMGVFECEGVAVCVCVGGGGMWGWVCLSVRVLCVGWVGVFQCEGVSVCVCGGGWCIVFFAF